MHLKLQVATLDITLYKLQYQKILWALMAMIMQIVVSQYVQEWAKGMRDAEGKGIKCSFLY